MGLSPRRAWARKINDGMTLKPSFITSLPHFLSDVFVSAVSGLMGRIAADFAVAIGIGSGVEQGYTIPLTDAPIKKIEETNLTSTTGHFHLGAADADDL